MFREWVRSCHDVNPLMGHYFFTDDSLLSLVDQHFPDWSDRWSDLPGIVRADLGRLLMLWVHGGVYLDVDYECLQPFEGLLRQAEENGHDLIVGEEHLVHVYLLENLNDSMRPFVSNAWIAATPQHPLIGAFLNDTLSNTSRLLNECGSDDAVACTGPRPLTRLVHGALDLEDEDTFPPRQCGERPPLGSVMVADFDVLYPEYAAWNKWMKDNCVRDPESTADDEWRILPRARDDLANQTWARHGCAMLAMAEDDAGRYMSGRSVAVHHWMCSSCRPDTKKRLRGGVTFDVVRDVPGVVLK
ncbi:unnamed protein product [Vitrella brassicaformis CCMP3155]|uniref:Alpha 1,4-glycosyltransferase domain-containing protein n=1 Tax=Vitrella brassicaformis (strain CCMP3155) TaxID=1169540 RepID=A0A0G4GPI7_VITBC|nr:unnamed protein product [Vitrella brassicaformis CCMP3155]|eukprot:CEM32295.1 unnamed protein product [Vitrella brassicaformis CCMP3155]